MCSCLQLAHRGLPCRHYFAVLLYDQSLQFDVAVIHPRWFTQSTARGLARQTSADTCSLPVALDTERLRAVQYMTMETIKGKIEQLAGDVRGLKSKAEYVKRLLDLEASHPPRAAAAEVVDVASR